uniref:CPSF73-100_C domain-containing protein n=1 Tax=Echinostoma caproni TaxID=27848 RepID=A0A183ARB3_9TREM
LIHGSTGSQLTTKTTNILIEVTGVQLDVCKEFAETVIAWLLTHTVSPPSAAPRSESVPLPAMDADATDTAPDGTPDALTKKRDLVVPQNALLVRPVRVVDSESASKLSSIFPSRLDLVAAKFGTVR